MVIGHDLGYGFLVLCSFDGLYRLRSLLTSFIACRWLRITIVSSRSRSIKIDCRSSLVVIYCPHVNRTRPVCVGSM